MYSEAEDAFTQVLKLDKNCDDAVQELLRVRIHQIEVSWWGVRIVQYVQLLQIISHVLHEESESYSMYNYYK